MAQVRSESSSSVIEDSQSQVISSSSDKQRRRGIDDKGKQKHAANKDTKGATSNSQSADSNHAASHKYDESKLQKALYAAKQGDRLSTITTISELEISRDLCTPSRPTVWRSTLNAAGLINVRQSVAQRGTLNELVEQEQSVAHTTQGCYLQFEYIKSHQVSAYYAETTSGQRVEKQFEVTGSEKHRVEMPKVARQVAHNGVTVGYRELSDPLNAALKYDPSGFREAFINAALSGDAQLLITADPLRGWYAQHEMTLSGGDQDLTEDERQMRKNVSQSLTVTCRTSMEICACVLDEHGMCVTPVRRSEIVQVGVVTRRTFVPFVCNSANNSSAYQADAECTLDGDRDADTNSRRLSSNATDPLDEPGDSPNLHLLQSSARDMNANQQESQPCTTKIDSDERRINATIAAESDRCDLRTCNTSQLQRFAAESVRHAPPCTRQAFSMPFPGTGRVYVETTANTQLAAAQESLGTEFVIPFMASKHDSPSSIATHVQLPPGSVQGSHVLIPVVEYNALITASTRTTQTVSLQYESDKEQLSKTAPLPYHLVRTLVHIDSPKNATHEEFDPVTPATPSKVDESAQPPVSTSSAPFRRPQAAGRASAPIVIGDESDGDEGEGGQEDEEFVDANSSLAELAGESICNPIAINAESESESEEPEEDLDIASAVTGQRVAFALGTSFRTRGDITREDQEDSERLTRSASALNSARPITRSATNSLTKPKYDKRDTIFLYERPGSSMLRQAARRCFDASHSNLSGNPNVSAVSQATDCDETEVKTTFVTPSKRCVIQKRRKEVALNPNSSTSSSCITSAPVNEADAAEILDLDATVDRDMQFKQTESPALSASRSGQKRRAKMKPADHAQ